MKARSPLFRHLQKSLSATSQQAQQPSISRRSFLQNSLVLGTGVALGASQFACKPNKTAPNIAIIGAGLAGLTAGYYLQKHGISAKIYEGSSRVGGRVFTLKEFAAPGTWTEMGGQYIDSSHHDMLQLCKELGLPLQDMYADTGEELMGTNYFLNGQSYSNADLAKEFASVAPFFQKDIAKFPKVISYKTPQFRDLDNTSLEEYIANAGASPLLKQVLHTAFTCEYGLHVAEQSALNMIYLMPPRLNQGHFAAIGDSDERYAIEGGNSTLAETLAASLSSHVEYELFLEAISAKGQGYSLQFQGGKQVKADAVILAIPFTMLRNVDIQLDLPKQKKMAIQSLGIGTNAKAALGFNERAWKSHGYIGSILTEKNISGWEHTYMQNNNTGPCGYTVYLGGAPGKDLKITDLDDHLNLLETAFPGCKAAHNGKRFIFNWSTNLYVKGSYTCYRPGQWTSFGGAEAENVGKIYFAGEHCSLKSQGFMNGAVESGKRAAEAILKGFKI